MRRWIFYVILSSIVAAVGVLGWYSAYSLESHEDVSTQLDPSLQSAVLSTYQQQKQQALDAHATLLSSPEVLSLFGAVEKKAQGTKAIKIYDPQVAPGMMDLPVKADEAVDPVASAKAVIDAFVGGAVAPGQGAVVVVHDLNGHRVKRFAYNSDLLPEESLAAEQEMIQKSGASTRYHYKCAAESTNCVLVVWQCHFEKGVCIQANYADIKPLSLPKQFYIASYGEWSKLNASPAPITYPDLQRQLMSDKVEPVKKKQKGGVVAIESSNGKRFFVKRFDEMSSRGYEVFGIQPAPAERTIMALPFWHHPDKYPLVWLYALAGFLIVFVLGILLRRSVKVVDIYEDETLILDAQRGRSLQDDTVAAQQRDEERRVDEHSTREKVKPAREADASSDVRQEALSSQRVDVQSSDQASEPGDIVAKKTKVEDAAAPVVIGQSLSLEKQEQRSGGVSVERVDKHDAEDLSLNSSFSEAFSDDGWGEIVDSFDSIFNISTSKPVTKPNTLVSPKSTPPVVPSKVLPLAGSGRVSSISKPDTKPVHKSVKKSGGMPAALGQSATLGKKLSSSTPAAKKGSSLSQSGLGISKSPSGSKLPPLSLKKTTSSSSAANDNFITQKTEKAGADQHKEGAFKAAPSWSGESLQKSLNLESGPLYDALKKRSKDASNLPSSVRESMSQELRATKQDTKPTQKEEIETATRSDKNRLSNSGIFSLTGSRVDIDPTNDTEYFKSLFKVFVETKKQCGESTEKISLDKFVTRLAKNKEALMKSYKCRTVKFQIYIRDGKTAVKATPIR